MGRQVTYAVHLLGKLAVLIVDLAENAVKRAVLLLKLVKLRTKANQTRAITIIETFESSWDCVRADDDVSA